MFWRALCDLIFSIQFIVFQLDYQEGRHTGRTKDGPSSGCTAYAFMFQFSVMGSVGWYQTHTHKNDGMQTNTHNNKNNGVLYIEIENKSFK